MNTWYAARLVFEAEIDGQPSEDPLCEESIRLLEAPDLAAAEGKAVLVGKESEHAYENEYKQVVRWRFRGVIELQDLCESQLSDGMEVFSKIFRKSGEMDR